LGIAAERQNIQAQTGFERLFSIGQSNLLRATKTTQTGGSDLGGWPAKNLAYIGGSGSGQKSANQRIAKSSHEFPGILGVDV